MCKRVKGLDKLIRQIIVPFRVSWSTGDRFEDVQLIKDAIH